MHDLNPQNNSTFTLTGNHYEEPEETLYEVLKALQTTFYKFNLSLPLLLGARNTDAPTDDQKCI